MESDIKAGVPFEEERTILTDPVICLKQVLRFDSDLDYIALLLWAAHTHMHQILPSNVCLYLAFDGKKSSGKTTATKVATLLACKGKMLGSVTPASLKRLCEEGCTLGIDEVDAHSKTDENLETILRVGNSWDAKGLLCQRSGGDWKTVEVNIGGPKVFNFRGEVDDALRSRCLVISMPCAKDASLSINSLFAESKLSFLKGYLEPAVRAHSNGWTEEKVRGHMQTEAFLERVGKVDPELGRGYQQAAILLVVSDIMGWELDARIREIVESQESEDPFEVEKDVIADWWSSEREKRKQEILSDPMATVQIASEELRSLVNAGLESRHLKPISKQRFSILKRELGFKEGVNARKSSAQRGKTILTFDESVLKSLGVGN
jgi:hypothetical protein